MSYVAAEVGPVFSAIIKFCEANVAALAVDGAALTIVGTTGGRLFVHSTDVMSFDLDELQLSPPVRCRRSSTRGSDRAAAHQAPPARATASTMDPPACDDVGTPGALVCPVPGRAHQRP